MKTTKTIAATIATLIAGAANAAPALQIDALGEFPRARQAVVRLNSFTDIPGDVSVSGFADFYGRSSDRFYSEVGARKELCNGIGAKAEWNGGSRMNDTFRLGVSALPKISDKLFLDVKAYPLNVGSDGRVQNSGQISLFGRVNLPRGFYLENWTDLNFDYKKLKVNVQSEGTLGKQLSGNLAAEVQGVYNVAVPNGFDARAGIRYRF